MTKKIVVPIIIVIALILAILALIFVIPKAEEKAQNEEEVTQEEEKHEIIHEDTDFGVAITLPKDLENHFKTKISDTGDNPALMFEYLVQDAGLGVETQFLFNITKYPATESIYEIKNSPNTLIVAQDMEYIYTVAQALDFPFEQDSEDGKMYSEMIASMEHAWKTIRPIEGVYTSAVKLWENNEEENLIVDVFYPQVSGIENENLNNVIKTQVEALVKAFKENILPPEEDVELPEGAKNGFNLIYTPKMLDDKIISLRLNVSHMMAGAAYPNSFTLPINYNLETDAEVSLADYFAVPETEYLIKVSELVKEKLSVEFKDRGADPKSSDLEQGTQAKIENFSNFNLVADGISFNFDPYAVAPRAVGSFQIVVTNEELGDIVK